MKGTGPLGLRVENTPNPKGNRRFLLNVLPKHSIGVEIGVAIGNFSSAILQVVKPKRLYLVDPWHHDPSADAANRFYGGGKGQKGMDEVAAFVAERFADKDNVEIRRKRSDEFLLETTPDFFDWVYVDGDHTYGPCMLDILLAIPKVKVGGIICGDDFDWAPELGFPVKRAVSDIHKSEKRLEIIKWVIKSTLTRMDSGHLDVSSKYEEYKDQQRRQYAKSVPIADWRKQLKNTKSNQKLLDMVPEWSDGFVWALDIGAGEGYHTEDLRKLGYSAMGVELLEKRVADAHKLGRHYVSQGDAHDLDWSDGSIQLVFMHEVLEHCARPILALKEIHRVLVPGGRFVISLPLEGHWKKRQAGIDDHDLSTRDTHVWKPVAADLWTALTEAGFEDFKIELCTLNSINHVMWYQPGAKVHGFQPHAFVEGTK